MIHSILAPKLRMPRIWMFMAVLCAWLPVADATPPLWPRPIAVVRTSDPWKPDWARLPQFALYEDGQVYFVRRTPGQRDTLMTARLTMAELSNAKARLLTFATVPVPANINLVPGATDLPTTHIQLNVDGHKLTTSVYGLLTIKEEGLETAAGADALPPQVDGLYAYVSRLQQVTATEWIPDQLEVGLSPHSNAAGGSTPWPTGWPGLDQADTRKRGSGYVIVLPGSQESALLALFERKNRYPRLIELGGRKWMAVPRRVFPRSLEVFPQE